MPSPKRAAAVDRCAPNGYLCRVAFLARASLAALLCVLLGCGGDPGADGRNHCLLALPVHCETLPALFPLAATIAAGRIDAPRLSVAYGFRNPAMRSAILLFVAELLG